MTRKADTTWNPIERAALVRREAANTPWPADEARNTFKSAARIRRRLAFIGWTRGQSILGYAGCDSKLARAFAAKTELV